MTSLTSVESFVIDRLSNLEPKKSNQSSRRRPAVTELGNLAAIIESDTRGDRGCRVNRLGGTDSMPKTKAGTYSTKPEMEDGEPEPVKKQLQKNTFWYGSVHFHGCLHVKICLLCSTEQSPTGF